MTQKMTWEEMKKTFPDEWLLVVDYEINKFGQVAIGIVERHTADMDEIAAWPLLDKPTALRYTGESTFAGLRSHAEHGHAF